MITVSNAHDSCGFQIEFDGCQDDHVPPGCRFNYQEENNEISNGKTISTCDLIYWSFQISKGMEYISNRKVSFLSKIKMQV